MFVHGNIHNINNLVLGSAHIKDTMGHTASLVCCHSALVLPPGTCQFPLNLVLWYKSSSFSSLPSHCLTVFALQCMTCFGSTIVHPQDISKPSETSLLDNKFQFLQCSDFLILNFCLSKRCKIYITKICDVLLPTFSFL